MRMTIHLDKALVQKIERYAADHSTTLTKIIEEAAAGKAGAA